jgi:predicted AlkP superfamily phosphohydrolase/phosphomutase
MQRRLKLLFSLFLIALTPLFGYVGPGAGFAFIGSFFLVIAAFFLAFFNLLTLPFRLLFRLLRRWRTLRRAHVRRVIVVGFDGMDHALLQALMDQGHPFPGFAHLAAGGSSTPLLSTEPPISPVAWSTFSTGVNPGKHNIFDFLTNDRKTYQAKLSGSDIIPAARMLRIGNWQFPLQRPRIELMRKSRSFWKIAADHGIHSTVLRVPYTFPPERFHGAMLSGLGTPDLRGCQGSFTIYSERNTTLSAAADGMWSPLAKTPSAFTGQVSGPQHPWRQDGRTLTLDFSIAPSSLAGHFTLTCQGQACDLTVGTLSPWQHFAFKAGLATVHGIAQWLVVKADPLQLYLSPLQIDPEKPAMPISQPAIFSVYHAKKMGPYATLGMAEDTWAVNEGIMAPDQFLQQARQVQAEREAIFLDTLAKVKQGLVVAVFEETDRVQHMFWKQQGGARPVGEPDQPIAASYQRMDALIQRLLPTLKRDDLLLIVSDHGFNSFEREFHLNAWLLQQGYLVLKPGQQVSGKWFAAVDWSRSRAYGQGLNGLVINQAGRESQGIVKPGAETDQLKQELQSRLMQLIDVDKQRQPIRRVFCREEIYQGAYMANAPDLVIGYATGYRVSWDSAVSAAGPLVFSDNVRPWSGDHAFTRDQVPGIFFCNHGVRNSSPSLADIAPTILTALGIPVPAWIDGRDLGIDYQRH